MFEKNDWDSNWNFSKISYRDHSRIASGTLPHIPNEISENSPWILLIFLQTLLAGCIQGCIQEFLPGLPRILVKFQPRLFQEFLPGFIHISTTITPSIPIVFLLGVSSEIILEIPPEIPTLQPPRII